MKIDSDIPRNWNLHIDEVSTGVFHATAVASDGRKIEISGSDADYLIDSVRSSIREFEPQVNKHADRQARRENLID